MSEQAIQQQIRLELGKGSVRLWRNNTGCLQDRQGRMVRFGLAPGSSDLIGLRQVTIGPEHVGKTLAVFCAVEVKAERGRASPEQLKFLQVVQTLGGLGGIARSVTDAQQILHPAHL
jgi:hypothetical protein